MQTDHTVIQTVTHNMYIHMCPCGMYTQFDICKLKNRSMTKDHITAVCSVVVFPFSGSGSGRGGIDSQPRADGKGN